MKSGLVALVSKGLLCTALPNGPLVPLRVALDCAAASGWPVGGGAGQALGFTIPSTGASGDFGGLTSAAQRAPGRPGLDMADFDRDVALRKALGSQARRRGLSVLNAQQK